MDFVAFRFKKLNSIEFLGFKMRLVVSQGLAGHRLYHRVCVFFPPYRESFSIF